MGTNRILFHALTLAFSNKDLEGFSDNCAHNKAKKFCLRTFFFVSFQLLQHFAQIKNFMPTTIYVQENRNLAHCAKRCFHFILLLSLK